MTSTIYSCLCLRSLSIFGHYGRMKNTQTCVFSFIVHQLLKANMVVYAVEERTVLWTVRLRIVLKSSYVLFRSLDLLRNGPSQLRFHRIPQAQGTRSFCLSLKRRFFIVYSWYSQTVFLKDYQLNFQMDFHRFQDKTPTLHLSRVQPHCSLLPYEHT